MLYTSISSVLDKYKNDHRKNIVKDAYSTDILTEILMECDYYACSTEEHFFKKRDIVRISSKSSRNVFWVLVVFSENNYRNRKVKILTHIIVETEVETVVETVYHSSVEYTKSLWKWNKG